MATSIQGQNRARGPTNARHPPRIPWRPYNHSMWPKAFAQLVELAPHISRLLPMADRFFQSRTVTDDPNRDGVEGNRKAVETMAEGLRGDFGQVTAAHVGLSQQILAMGVTLDTIAGNAEAARSAANLAAASMERRFSAVETRQARTLNLLAIVLGLLVVVCLLLTFLLLRGR